MEYTEEEIETESMNKTKIDWTDYSWNPVIGCKHKEWIEKVLHVVKDNPQHTFQFLTKNPSFLREVWKMRKIVLKE